MTAYKNFVEDYPNRCLEVLNMAKKQARMKGRDVTLLLIVASAGLIVPLERLKKTEKDGQLKTHPSGDAEKFQSVAGGLNNLLKTEFLSSPLAKDASGWRIGEIGSIDTQPDTWIELQNAKEISKKKTCSPILKIIRNALAHGNIFTRSGPNRQINEIVFVSYKAQNSSAGFVFLSVTPDGFENFLRCWFKYLSDNHVPMEQINAALIDEAA